MNIGKILIALGVVFILVGLLWTFIGKLPGDIHVRRGSFSLYIPITTSIIISVILSIILFFFRNIR